jgi:hypothetical protein
LTDGTLKLFGSPEVTLNSLMMKQPPVKPHPAVFSKTTELLSIVCVPLQILKSKMPRATNAAIFEMN